VRDFVRWAAEGIGLALAFEGEGTEEVGRDSKTGAVVVRVNPEYFRPAEVDLLVGDATKARTVLGWVPTMDVRQLAQVMVEADVRRAVRGPILG
jgi:GDPmannose 4,6-dehydratase